MLRPVVVLLASSLAGCCLSPPPRSSEPLFQPIGSSVAEEMTRQAPAVSHSDWLHVALQERGYRVRVVPPPGGRDVFLDQEGDVLLLEKDGRFNLLKVNLQFVPVAQVGELGMTAWQMAARVQIADPSFSGVGDQKALDGRGMAISREFAWKKTFRDKVLAEVPGWIEALPGQSSEVRPALPPPDAANDS
jgi:hypothetical protein